MSQPGNPFPEIGRELISCAVAVRAGAGSTRLRRLLDKVRALRRRRSSARSGFSESSTFDAQPGPGAAPASSEPETDRETVPATAFRRTIVG